MIYVIACSDMKAMKIGFSNNPRARLKDIQTACPFDLQLIGVILNAGLEEEKAFHDQMNEFRLRGEWFALTMPAMNKAGRILHFAGALTPVEYEAVCAGKASPARRPTVAVTAWEAIERERYETEETEVYYGRAEA